MLLFTIFAVIAVAFATPSASSTDSECSYQRDSLALMQMDTAQHRDQLLQADDELRAGENTSGARRKRQEQIYWQASLVRMASCREHAPQAKLADGVPMAGSVLYVIKTYSGVYNTKLRAVMETWAAKVPESSLLIIGDQPHEKYPVHVADECGADPNLGLACRVAHGVELAAKTPGNWSWVLVIDDDHYVKTENLELFLARFDANKLLGVGCYGCGSGEPFHFCHGKGGFCGGCGYAFSRAAVMKAVAGHEADFRAEHLAMAKSRELSEQREDMAMSSTMTSRVPNMDIQLLEGHGIDGHNVEDLMTELRRDGCGTKSTIWHWIQPETMQAMHKLITTDGPSC